MEVACSSVMLVNLYHSTLRHILEYSTCENFWSHIKPLNWLHCYSSCWKRCPSTSSLFNSSVIKCGKDFG